MKELSFNLKKVIKHLHLHSKRNVKIKLSDGTKIKIPTSEFLFVLEAYDTISDYANTCTAKNNSVLRKLRGLFGDNYRAFLTGDLVTHKYINKGVGFVNGYDTNTGEYQVEWLESKTVEYIMLIELVPFEANQFRELEPNTSAIDLDSKKLCKVISHDNSTFKYAVSYEDGSSCNVPDMCIIPRLIKCDKIG